ncbi:hypothetical protein EV702DRAFT_1123669 [Suillus placidus]|uniref:Uncharacterized protein n=1 Tax=Suillus placidus TaxID=48579 RepID=A0A9P6ZR23_9AGAM|nr:hypothetical protein EV702DRAFT_1123669 [Suillus placidus]
MLSSDARDCLEWYFGCVFCCSAACSLHLPPQFIIPIPVDQMKKTTLGKISWARLLSLFKKGELAKRTTRAEVLLIEARYASFVASSTQTKKALARICAGIFNLAASELLASDKLIRTRRYFY